MDKQIKLSTLKGFLESQDVPIVGVTLPFSDPDLIEQLKEHDENGRYVFFGDVSIEQRQNVEAVFPSCKQIIVIGIPYNSKNEYQDDTIRQPGFISNMAWAYDYHHVLYHKLTRLSDYLKNHLPTINTLAQVDTGPLIDRHIAYKAGLGSYGKNQNLMHPVYGTEFYIGYLLVDAEVIETDIDHQPLPLRAKACQNCRACVKSCPAQVLGEDYSFDGKGCISYLTQKKSELSMAERTLVANNIYGCDVCQLVCPQNKKKQEIPSIYKRSSVNTVELETFIEQSNKALMRLYRESGFAWRGAKVLKRNAVIALGHYENQENILFLKNMLTQDNPFLLPSVIWALYKSGAEDIENICREIISKAQDENVIATCKEVLLLLK